MTARPPGNPIGVNVTLSLSYTTLKTQDGPLVEHPPPTPDITGSLAVGIIHCETKCGTIVFYCLFVVVLCPSNIKSHIRTGTDL